MTQDSMPGALTDPPDGIQCLATDGSPVLECHDDNDEIDALLEVLAEIALAAARRNLGGKIGP